ncbi:hypothetical protein [uncultured Roseivirga sp.]|mgnify:CR=1 FL=1|uniref:hypothetical protein n=1 Tax=uncultured Roseivirga sp. TaxID=543088 RepID=UPI0030D9E8C2|tara:strand:- start:904 stop:1467 length:564 start_codon:yes stop_codon:yes gene_type:complete
MKPAKKIATGLAALGLIFSLNAKAQGTANDNRVAFNGASGAKTEITKKRDPLVAPVVKEGGSYDAALASWDKNVSVMVYRDSTDSVAGELYAKSFANALAQSDKTGGRPIYATAVHMTGDAKGQSFVVFFVDGEQWDFKGQDRFTPADAWKLLPFVMKDYTDEHGYSKIIPDTQKPTLIVASNDLQR